MFRRKEDEENDQLEFGNDNALEDTSPEGVEEVIRAEEKTEIAEEKMEEMRSTKIKAAEPATATATPRPAPATNFRPAVPVASAPVSAARAPLPAASETRTPSPASGNASKRILTVGNDIHMKGEINTCDRLVIEGIVDATLKDVHTVELAETGSLRGTAEVEDAEISGYFEGDLTVTGRLIIYATGTVRGNVSYGEIEIERGGQLSGSLSQVGEAPAAKKTTKKAA